MISFYYIVSANAETDINDEMMIKESYITEKLDKSIKEIFDSTGVVKVTRTGLAGIRLLNLDSKPDLAVQVETKESEQYLIIFEVKSTGQPRYARMAVNQLQSILVNRKNVYGVFGAPFVSEESKKICREAGIGYLDLAGNCFLGFNSVYISIEGGHNPYPATRPLKSIFSTKSTRALRVLLCNPKKDWFVKDLAKEAAISIGQASNLKKRLLEYELIEQIDHERGMKFRIANPEALLTRWADNYSYLKNRIKNYYSLDEVKTIEKKLVDYFNAKQILYAFTLTSGASLVAPALRYKRVFAYVSSDSDCIGQELGLKEVTSGPNVSLLEPYDDGVFYGAHEVQWSKVVSDIQLFLDLKSYKERGEEAARFILEQRLRKQW